MAAECLKTFLDIFAFTLTHSFLYRNITYNLLFVVATGIREPHTDDYFF